MGLPNDKLFLSVKLWVDRCINVVFASFYISSRQRIPGASDVVAVISFIPYHQVQRGSVITLMYPETFFRLSDPPYVAVGSSSVASLSVSISQFYSNHVMFNVTGGGINASSAFSITMSGLTLGNRTIGSNVSLIVNGCTDSNFLFSGRIFSKVLDTSFTIAHADRLSGKYPVSATVAFTASATVIPTGSNITLNYPFDFLGPSAPFVQPGATSVADLALACSSASSASIVLTTSDAVIGTSPFVVTISGLTMGSSGANVTGGISITTSVHPDPSDGIDSGLISCPPGSYWTGQPPSCTRCPAGTYHNATDAWSCTPCDPGRFCDALGLLAVSGLCPAGSYSPSGAAASSCTICGDGTYSTKFGQSFTRPAWRATKLALVQL